ncbi:NADP-dependent oxidoreductase [Nonomuraea mesophila]|uniref:NADP-dependent oxidoreductase n=1 Tax=Nonomuraea mesophila TaxID=2530382 RepID=A0A4R5E7J1_9ACTN|nr:NADP-dependent oxidoreductase [Nonomuraea mesophila]TDE26876.1 NADP-dependent oxidoreductase [Nonomuraea mesophila]
MRATAISAFGARPELVELPEPAPGPGELLVRLRAAAYNPVDTKIASGAMKGLSPRFPLIMGQDGAGVVEAVGDAVTAYRPGDEVYGRFADPARGLGSYAEYGVVAQDGPVARMPKGLLPEQAAAVPTASATACALLDAADLAEGQTVLIIGATGGVGQAATQLAALRRAYVIATAAPDAEELMRELGANETVDHTKGDVPGEVAAAWPDGVDAVFDLVGPSGAVDAMAGVLRPGGVICSVVHALDPDALARRGLRGVNVINRVTPEVLTRLSELIDGGELRVRVESLVPLERAPAVLSDIAAGRARGKTVIMI